ncbi:hypothetical protein HPB50_016545 [Hyalomma asiaticum]|uniref:Uncharacterized protein n=1 Tax=Hyalomma asiaticum TaxID=266040 RepID=A0ACB7SWA9_HYAAI|nr:hypothetical protein HPB50_016545 [Hyalomma asiaticum]
MLASARCVSSFSEETGADVRSSHRERAVKRSSSCAPLQHHGLPSVKLGGSTPSSHLFRQLVWRWEFDGIALSSTASVIFGGSSIIIAQPSDCVSPLPRACL